MTNYNLPCKDLGDILLTIKKVDLIILDEIVKTYALEIPSGKYIRTDYFKADIVKNFLVGPEDLVKELENLSLGGGKDISNESKYLKTVGAIYKTIISIYPGLNIQNICSVSNQKAFFSTPSGKQIKRKMSEMVTPLEDGTILIEKPKGKKKKLLKEVGIYSLEDISEFEEYAKSKLVGQNEAVKEVAKNLKLITAQLVKFRVLMFVGKSGVGKTELAKLLGEKYSGNFYKINCGEYSHGNEWTKLVGATPGYVGYTDKSLLKEKSDLSDKWVFLLDEIEKAGPKFYDFLLSLFDDGTVDDNNGVKLNFSNSIFILTSNIGSKDIKEGKQLGFSSKKITYKESREELIASVKRHFPPEFIGRVNDFVIFNELTEDNLKEIIALHMSSLLPVESNIDVVNYILSKQDVLNIGARGIVKLVMDEIGTLVADQLLNYMQPFEGSTYNLIMQDGKPTIINTKKYESKLKASSKKID